MLDNKEEGSWYALDDKMRIFETAHDHCVLPEIFMVARLDGRGFTKLTRKRFDAPFDERFHQLMVDTVNHLLSQTGLNFVYGYTQSDEISLLFHPQEDSFSRKLRKLNSVLAGEASAKFSFLFGDLAAFDCRISQLPTLSLVIDYFLWRARDSFRNALNAYCYWKLRDRGETKGKATSILRGMSASGKQELLFQEFGINFNDVCRWHKQGTGVCWQEYEKEAVNKLTGESVLARRRKLVVEENLPVGKDYSDFVGNLVIRSMNP